MPLHGHKPIGSHKWYLVLVAGHNHPQVEEFYEKALQQGSLDFPLKCSVGTRGFVPKLTSLSGVEEEHDSSFWKSVEWKINTDKALLWNVTWQDFFHQFHWNDGVSNLLLVSSSLLSPLFTLLCSLFCSIHV
jgi:hypothetical protein